MNSNRPKFSGPNLGLFFGALLLVVTTSVLWKNIQDLPEQEWWVNHTHDVLGTLETLFSDLLDAESGERAFFIVRDEAASVRMQGAFNRLQASIEKLSNLTADSPVQADNLKQLRDLIDIRVRMAQEIAKNFRIGKIKTVSPQTFEEERRALRAVRDKIDFMESQEKNLLVRRSQEAEQSGKVTMLTLVVVAGVNLLACIGVWYLARRQIAFQYFAREEERAEARARDAEMDMTQITLSHPSIQQMGEPILRYLTKTVNAAAANFFTYFDGKLALAAGYGTSNHGPEIRSLLERAGAGQGLVGKALFGGDIKEVHDVPRDYFRVESSLGKTVPSHLIFLPIRFQDRPVGLIEIASFSAVNEADRDWLKRVTSALGIGLHEAFYKARLQELLEETQRQTEELQTQQEELRTSNEELEQQTKALLQSNERLQNQQEELHQVNEELESQTRSIERQNAEIHDRNLELEKARASIEQKMRELEQTNQYKSEFLAKMSHELRTPLNSLMILATLLRENKQGNLTAQQIEFAQTIQNAGQDLLDLINDILDLSKLEARKLVARPESFSLKYLFDELTTTFKPLTDKRNLALHAHIQEGLPERLNTDRQRLQQVLRNFLSNAVKFTEEGSIVLKAEASPKGKNFVILSVTDTGLGISPDKRNLIFEAFEQADSTMSRKYGGTGLGLTISRELSHLLGGNISVESELDKGSCFSLEIPVDLSKVFLPANDEPWRPIQNSNPKREAPQKAVEISDATLSAAKKALKGATEKEKTILIVEDDQVVRKAVAEAAKQRGFHPIEAADAEVALEILNHHKPKGIMLDVKLPGFSGITFLERVKEVSHLRHIPIHMVSAMENEATALQLGAMGYLEKPVTASSISEALEKIEKIASQKVKRLLVIEDNPGQRKAIVELVSGKDLEIVSVESGQEALQILKSSRVDCVILDLSLPDMSGFEILESLRAQSSQSVPPVIIYTGKDLSPSDVEKLRYFSDSIIIKGAKSPERLLDEVSLFLHRVENMMPEEKRAILADVRMRDKSLEGRKILIVDDDLRNVFALTSALEARGCVVHPARNGLEGVEKLYALSSVDAVLMDLMMPKMGGLEAISRIRSDPKFKSLPIIVLTAKAMKGEYEKCIQAGASDYLTKPINLMNLFSVLKAWLSPARWS